MKKRIFTAVAVVLPLTLAGCAANTSGPGSSPSSNPGASDEATIKVVTAGTIDFSAIDVAEWQTMAAKDGITLNLSVVDSFDAAFRTLVAGTVDISIGAPEGTATAIQNTQAPLTIVAANAPATDYVVLAKNSITDISQLKGATIGTNTPGSGGDAVMKIALKKKGFDITTPKYVTIGGTSARVAALQAGQIDATVAHLSEAEAAVKTGKFRILLECGPAIGPYMQTALIANNNWLDKGDNKSVMQRVVNALIDAERWSATHKAEYIALSKKYDTEMDDSLRGPVYDEYLKIGLWGVNGGITESAVENWFEAVKSAGILAADSPDPSTYVDYSYVDAYLKANGEFKP